MYTYQITNVPLSSDPTQSVVTATLADDSGAPEIVRNYSLPVADNPQPSDFANLIQTDVDALNAAQEAQTNLASIFTVQSVVPIDTNVLQTFSEGTDEVDADSTDESD
jgi:predicted component of type VI protein secretion system